MKDDMIRKDDFIQSIKQSVLSQAPLAQVSLFGSRSRGDAKHDYDEDTARRLLEPSKDLIKSIEILLHKEP